jgi:hypothetical protein
VTAKRTDGDFGGLSGWTFLVNGERPKTGASSVSLSDGDRIEWVYTVDLPDDFEKAGEEND